MDISIWSLVGSVLLIVYLCLAAYFIYEGVGYEFEWWKPFVLAVTEPIRWAAENWATASIAIVILGIVVYVIRLAVMTYNLFHSFGGLA